MRRKTASLLAVALGALVAAGAAVAQTKPEADFGKREYTSNCAVCHGTSGKGDGFYEGILKQKPTNLTILSKSNGGVFPTQRVYEIIDGRQMIAAHGTRDMPIWGADYYKEGAPYDTAGIYDPEAYVRVRILALTDYLARIQVK
jgi:mono/diheme cytochrome c family protein